MEVADLELAEQADAHHLDAREDEDAGDDEDGAVKVHDVLTGEELEDEQPGGEA